MKSTAYQKYLPYIKSRGFTMLESLVVLGIMAIAFGAAAESFRQSRNKANLEEGKATIIRTLERARSRSASGNGALRHGVRIEPDKVTLFEGSDIAGGTQFRLPPSIVTDQTALDIHFERLLANSSASTTINISGPGGASKQIRVTYDGTINP